MRATQQFLEGEFQVFLLLLQTPGVANRMNQPSRGDAKLALLIFARQRVSLFKPLGQRQIVGIEQFSQRKKTEAKRGPG